MQFKLSKYTVLSDTFPGPGDESLKVLYSSRTGQALTIKGELLPLLQAGETGRLDYDELEQLIGMEALVPADEDELLTVIEQNRNFLKDNTTLSYIIQPTALCQLGCDYCGQEHKRKQLSDSDQEAVLQRIENKLQSGHYTALRVSWFGSEPLMGYSNIRELTPKLVELAGRHHCAYSAAMVTNGLSLKKNIFDELTRHYAIRSFEVTLDGIAEFHDQRRHTKEGHSTFDIIFNNILAICNSEDLTDSGAEISIRCNIDRRNYEGVLPLIRLLANHGLHKKLKFYPSPIHSWGNDAHTLSLEKKDYAAKETEWILEMIRLGFVVTGLLPSLKRGVCIAVTDDAEVVDAYGNIYNCTEVPYVPVYENSDYVLGNIRRTSPEKIERPRSFQDWNTKVLTENNACSRCNILPVCGGMCPKSWEEGINACPSNKFNLKEKLVLAYLYTNEAIKDTVAV